MTYIGQKEVTSQEEVDGKIKYSFADGTGDTVTTDQFDSMKSEEVYDDGMVRIRKHKPLVSAILELFLKYDIMLVDAEFVTSRTLASVQEFENKVISYLLNARHQDWVKMSELDKVLKSIPSPTPPSSETKED